MPDCFPLSLSKLVQLILKCPIRFKFHFDTRYACDIALCSCAFPEIFLKYSQISCNITIPYVPVNCCTTCESIWKVVNVQLTVCSNPEVQSTNHISLKKNRPTCYAKSPTA